MWQVVQIFKCCNVFVCFCLQKPKDICIHAGFCTSEKRITPLMKLLAAKTVPAVKTMPALKVFPATKMEPFNGNSAVVST